MTDYKPFAMQGHYTEFANIVLDEIMPKLKGGEWKVLSFIIRKTKGWHKDWDQLSFSQIKKGTGIKHNQTVGRAIAALADLKLVLVSDPDNVLEANSYKLNPEFTISITTRSSKSEPRCRSSKSDLNGGSKTEPSRSSKSDHTKERVFKETKQIKEEKEEAPPTHSQSPQSPAPAPAPKSAPAPTGPIAQELAILDLYRKNITPMPAPLTYDSIAADILDLDQAGQDPLEVFTYAITQAVGASVLRYNYIQAIVADIRDSKMTLAAYIQKRQAKTNRNGGSSNGKSPTTKNHTPNRKQQPVNIAGQFDN